MCFIASHVFFCYVVSMKILCQCGGLRCGIQKLWQISLWKLVNVLYVCMSALCASCDNSNNNNNDIVVTLGAQFVTLISKNPDGFTSWPSAQRYLYFLSCSALTIHIHISWNWNSVDVGPHRDICGELMQAVKAKGLKMGLYYSLYE